MREDLPKDYLDIIDEYEATDDELEVRLTWNPPGDWVAEASCAEVDPERWYPEQGTGNSNASRWAIAICRMCPVRKECLDYAIEVDDRWGLWGGMNFHERQAEKARRKLPVVELAA